MRCCIWFVRAVAVKSNCIGSVARLVAFRLRSRRVRTMNVNFPDTSLCLHLCKKANKEPMVERPHSYNRQYSQSVLCLGSPEVEGCLEENPWDVTLTVSRNRYGTAVLRMCT